MSLSKADKLSAVLTALNVGRAEYFRNAATHSAMGNDKGVKYANDRGEYLDALAKQLAAKPSRIQL